MGKFKRDLGKVIHTAKTVFFTSTETGEEKALSLFEQVVICSTASYTGTVLLPNVGEAKGLTYSIQLRTAGNNLTVADRNDSQDWNGDDTLDTADDYVEYRSDGIRWILLASEKA